MFSTYLNTLLDSLDIILVIVTAHFNENKSQATVDLYSMTSC